LYVHAFMVTSILFDCSCAVIFSTLYFFVVLLLLSSLRNLLQPARFVGRVTRETVALMTLD
jgi:hypothetical protein